ncbi:MAG: hypothetical protein HY906_11475 [Deltaproteobacteria bacterium]|nr:hypothetical protein [Deltaproteobacteria bacterium]
MATFLARLKTLEAGTDPSRAASREADKKAVELLEKRGITRAMRAHLGQLVETALGPTPPLAAMPGPDPARQDKLIALKLAFDEWATAARTVITKRSYLIRLGLASRRAPKADDSENNG